MLPQTFDGEFCVEYKILLPSSMLALGPVTSNRSDQRQAHFRRKACVTFPVCCKQAEITVEVVGWLAWNRYSFWPQHSAQISYQVVHTTFPWPSGNRLRKNLYKDVLYGHLGPHHRRSNDNLSQDQNLITKISVNLIFNLHRLTIMFT